LLTARDSPNDTAIVNRTLGRTFSPGEDPIGKKIDLLSKSPKTIIGVAADSKNPGLNQARFQRWTAHYRPCNRE
jgi:hypothetical protein